MKKVKKKKLLFTAYNFGIGGIESALINLLNRIDYSKYDVDVVLEQKKGDLLDDVNPNVKVKEFRVCSNKNIILRKLINGCRRLGFLLLNYHKYDFSCCYATYSKSGAKISLIASRNSSFYVHSDYKYVYKKKGDFLRFFDEREINKFRRIIFVSNESCNSFCKLYPQLREKLMVFNNFIDVDKIEKLSLEKVEEKRNKKKILFTFVGRLDDSSKKLGRAFEIVNNIKNLELFVIGDGPDREKYEALVRKLKLTDRVFFLGAKKNPYPYIRMCDYLILTSDYEGFPVTYLEAIALKKPIITTIDVSCDGINIGKDCGYIISKDEVKMIEEVRKILSSPRSSTDIDLNSIQDDRIKELEKLFDEVI